MFINAPSYIVVSNNAFFAAQQKQVQGFTATHAGRLQACQAFATRVPEIINVTALTGNMMTPHPESRKLHPFKQPPESYVELMNLCPAINEQCTTAGDALWLAHARYEQACNTCDRKQKKRLFEQTVAFFVKATSMCQDHDKKQVVAIDKMLIGKVMCKIAALTGNTMEKKQWLNQAWHFFCDAKSVHLQRNNTELAAVASQHMGKNAYLLAAIENDSYQKSNLLNKAIHFFSDAKHTGKMTGNDSAVLNCSRWLGKVFYCQSKLADSLKNEKNLLMTSRNEFLQAKSIQIRKGELLAFEHEFLGGISYKLADVVKSYEAKNQALKQSMDLFFLAKKDRKKQNDDRMVDINNRRMEKVALRLRELDDEKNKMHQLEQALFLFNRRWR